MSLQGKAIIIVGATSGLGAALASTLSQAGASVFIGGRRAKVGAQVAIDTNVTFQVVDVADEVSTKDFFLAAQKHFGGPQTVDFIFLNAGVEGSNEESQVTSATLENFDHVYNVNVRGVVLGLKYGLPLLRTAGTIVVTSSVGSIIPNTANPIYSSSKAAVDSLIRSYAAQFKDMEDELMKSFTLVGVNPTLYETDMVARFMGNNSDVMHTVAKMVNPCQRIGKVEEFGNVMLQFARGDLPYQSGDIFSVDADTHFPLAEYLTRIAQATKGTA